MQSGAAQEFDFRTIIVPHDDTDVFFNNSDNKFPELLHTVCRSENTEVLESVDNRNPLKQETVMSYEATYKSYGIPDEILDGIFPKEMTQPEQKSSETEEKKNEKPCEITDDIPYPKHPKIQTNANKRKQNSISSTYWIV